MRPVQMGNCWVAISALQTGGCNALDEVLLQGQEYDQDRDQCDNGSRHDQAILGRVLADEHTQADLDGLELGLGQVDQGSEEVVPRVDEGKDDQRRYSGQRKRQHDAGIDAVLGQTVDTGSLAQLGGNALIELLHHENTEGAERLQEDDGQMGVVQVPGAHHHELGHHVSLPRHREQAITYSPKSFAGACHIIRARFATPEEIAARRNLAYNPYDEHGDTGFFPHAHANVETRGEAVFAARNAIDGVYENDAHGIWPYQSWGINRDPNAALTLDFGRPVTIDELRLTLRADFPHDAWWTQATVEFDDGSREVLELKKSAAPQCFAIAPRTVKSLKLFELIKAEDPSPFPALTQIEAWGVEA